VAPKQSKQSRRRSVRPKPRPIHENIKTFRLRLNLSHRELAAKLDLDETTISHWERGKSAPAGTRLARVADALGVSVGELFGERAA
jgi:transcriptional regulator with XRE-family HTH domain